MQLGNSQLLVNPALLQVSRFLGIKELVLICFLSREQEGLRLEYLICFINDEFTKCYPPTDKTVTLAEAIGYYTAPTKVIGKYLIKRIDFFEKRIML